MQILEPKKLFVIAFSLAAMAHGSWQLAPAASASGGACCWTTADCPTEGQIKFCCNFILPPCGGEGKSGYCLDYSAPCPPE
jgi:hypothetical protein